MKKRNLLFVLVGAAFLFTSIFIMQNPMPANAEERCNIITMFGRNNLSSEKITISKGDCVLWMNWTRDDEVTLSFDDGAGCIKAVKSPKGWALDNTSGCFIAQSLMYGSTVSLVFTEAGTYEYDFIFKVGGKTDGVVIVK